MDYEFRCRKCGKLLTSEEINYFQNYSYSEPPHKVWCNKHWKELHEWIKEKKAIEERDWFSNILPILEIKFFELKWKTKSYKSFFKLQKEINSYGKHLQKVKMENLSKKETQKTLKWLEI